MRFLYGFFAVFLWIVLCTYVLREDISVISTEMQLLTVAIVAAGAMAGGD